MRHALLLVVLLVAAALAFTPSKPSAHHLEGLYVGRDHTRSITEEFKEFCQKYNKHYSPAEFIKRQAIYLKNLAQITAHNLKYKQGLVGWKQDINEFTDETLSEFLSHLGYENDGRNKSDSIPASVAFAKTKRFADPIDWRQRGVLGHVKNQGRCGSCWAFATTGATEACVALATGQVPSLSDQQLQDCMFSRKCDPGGGGGAEAIDWIKNNGIAAESEYPYTQNDGNCHSTQRKWRNAGRVHGDNEDQLMRMVYQGPVLIGLNADLLGSYHGGVIDDANYDRGRNHAVLVIGWTTNCDGRSERCWIIRNQWGEGWGEAGGHFRVAMGKRVIGLGDDSDMPTGCTSPDGGSKTTEYGPMESQDRPGSDLGAMQNANSAEECQAKCFYNQQCRAWSFDTCGNGCWLKSGNPGASPAGCRASGMITANRNGGSGNRRGPYGPIETVDRGGDDMPNGMRSAPNAEDCQAQCKGTNGCKAWAFDSCGNGCWLKSGNGQLSQRSCRLSGIIDGGNNNNNNNNNGAGATCDSCGGQPCCRDDMRGNMCYGNDHSCVKDQGNGKTYLCAKNNGSCNTACFDTNRYQCVNGGLQPK